MKPLLLLLLSFTAAAEPLPLKRAVELALSHSTTASSAAADEQRALASYHEARNQYIPQVVAGAGLGASYGFPLSLEGAAPSLFNVNSQSALYNPALREFVRAAKTEWQASALQGKDQRNQVIQDTVLTYAELNKWESLAAHLKDAYSDASKMEQLVNQRIQEGIDSESARNQARLSTARAYLRTIEARGSIDILRAKLAQLTGLAAADIETVAESIPSLPDVKQEDDLVARAVQSNPAIDAANTRAAAQELRAKGEHRALLPSVDFAAQYALLSRFNNYDEFYNRFERNNATVGVSIRFPFLSPTQFAHAKAADAQAILARNDAKAAKNQVSEETLRLQRSVQQLSAAAQVAELEYQVASSGVEALEIKAESSNATIHDVDDARTQSNERFSALQDAKFQLERAQITLLRATGDLTSWLAASN
ncbi:MAG TPA: TolC family protein [Terriglobales bacterium]|jgi:outer membrane protein TolC|nr:TolC family protein [Terriglobales bacterium]